MILPDLVDRMQHLAAYVNEKAGKPVCTLCVKSFEDMSSVELLMEGKCYGVVHFVHGHSVRGAHFTKEYDQLLKDYNQHQQTRFAKYLVGIAEDFECRNN